MSRRTVLILGSGGLRIGQAGEFDYSGSQALKALREEHIRTVLVNPNIATVQTNDDMADRIYFEPLTVKSVTQIIVKEKPDHILLGFGGQTALNLGLELDRLGVLAKHKVSVLGTPVSVINCTEDRALFKKSLSEIGVHTARSIAVYTPKQAVDAGEEIGYPIMMRSGFSLGGLGSGLINNSKELVARVTEVFHSVDQVLIEEYLYGWKEIEYEVVRDTAGNCVTVCNMENLDPMGVHTGESIVVAPSQTLNNEQYHRLREVALRTISHLGIVGECNIQYALHPTTGDYRVIEVNARLSRSSALASKATGYPLAYVATKILLGKNLPDITNAVTGTTSAFFEPALDYLAVKIPRWDLHKFSDSDHRIGSEMKSVGEVMGLGRSFPEALQKAIRMLNNGCDGLSFHPYEFTEDEISRPTDRRIFAIYDALLRGETIQQLHKKSQIHIWFLHHLQHIAEYQKLLVSTPLTATRLREAKQLGFSDTALARLKNTTVKRIRTKRLSNGIVPVIKQIDTLAGEADAKTNYLYVTYHGSHNDVQPLDKPYIVIGSGPYSIGSSVEFDWSAVATVQTLRTHAVPSVLINSNPETVSTDFDRSDRLYFEELTQERVQDIAEFEQPEGIIVSVGGQIANNLALPLSKAGLPISGTTPTNIDRAEDRNKFSGMLRALHIDQPEWSQVSSLAEAKRFADRVTYPVLIRPSYVLSGGAMKVVRKPSELEGYLRAATQLSPDHPVVISKFIEGAKELEIDGVAENGKIVLYAISEHLENAGVHSGDATVVYPAQRLYIETIRRVKKITASVIGALHITGPFNIQFIAKDNQLKVIECNVRASRSFPFVSKVSGHNFIQIATEVMLGKHTQQKYQTLDLDLIGVKSPVFSYQRIKGTDPIAGVEMASTGEVATIGTEFNETFYRSWLATGQSISSKQLILSIPDSQKFRFVDLLKELSGAGWTYVATAGTHEFLTQNGITSSLVYKIHEVREPSISQAIRNADIGLAIIIPSPNEKYDDAKAIRRLCVDTNIALVTNAEIAYQLLRSISLD